MKSLAPRRPSWRMHRPLGLHGAATKYGARPTESLGQRFPSHLEAHVYAHLWQRQKAGDITDLLRQPRVHLCCTIRWYVDFSYVDTVTGRLTYAEAKGFEVPEYILKRKLWTVFGPGPLWVYKRSGRGVKAVECIEPDLKNLGLDHLKLTPVGSP